jgi:AcrR family transcriptional regulator
MRSKPAAGKPPSETSSLHGGDGTQTRERILDATFRRLVSEGYAALSVREIAKDAGVNHALINYHFRSKGPAGHRRARCREPAAAGAPGVDVRSGGGFAQQWGQRAALLRDDLASGFVRLQAELWAASLSNPSLREKFLPRLLAWKKLVLGAVREALTALQADGTKLPPALTPEVIACWISEFWLGMEFADLLGVKEEQAQHRAALDAVEWLLKSLDSKVLQAAERGAPGRAPSEPPMNTPNLPRIERLERIAGPLPTPGSVPAADASPYDTVQPVREGFVDRDGVKLWFAVWGDSGPWLAFAPPLQIAHSQMLKGAVPYLSRHFRVITTDGRGNGRSDRPSGQDAYSFDHFHADFVAVLDAVGAERVALVGIPPER